MTGSNGRSWLPTCEHTRTASSVGVTLLVMRSALSFRRFAITRRDGREWGSWRESVGKTFSLNSRLHDDGRSESFRESGSSIFVEYRPYGPAANTTSLGAVVRHW